MTGKHYSEYIREEMLPHMWCSGCSHGTTLSAIARAMASLALDPTKTVVVTGIGCWGKADEYFRTHALHGTHGRALSFATGVKVANPALKVIVLMGDGDAVTIGGNHFIHTARRNIDLTAVITNNFNYGMTGGQYSASSPQGSITSTSPYGTPEPGFDICQLARTSGSTFIARSTPYHVTQLERLLAQAITHKGFSVVEVISSCPTYFARYNHQASPVEMLSLFRDKALTLEKYEALDAADQANHFPIGKLYVEKRGDFHERYAFLQQSARKTERGSAT